MFRLRSNSTTAETTPFPSTVMSKLGSSIFLFSSLSTSPLNLCTITFPSSHHKTHTRKISEKDNPIFFYLYQFQDVLRGREMEIPSQHLYTFPGLAWHKTTTKHKQCVIRYVRRVPDINTCRLHLLAVNQVWQREEIHSSINRSRVDIYFTQLFSVEGSALPSSFALHNVWVQPRTQNRAYHFHILAVLIVYLRKKKGQQLLDY